MSFKKAAVINDLSGLGKCSLTAAIPILSLLGVEACPVPTAVLTAQTGFESFYMEDLTDKIPIYTSEWKKLGVSFDAIFTGFIGSLKQINYIEEFALKFKTKENILLVDPVMADNGKIYSTYTKEMCQRLCRFALSADIVTPNLTEACMLAEESYSEYSSTLPEAYFEDKYMSLAQKIAKKGPKTVIITGIEKNVDNQRYIYNLALEQETKKVFFVKNKAFGSGFSGTGDIFSSIICACAVNKIPLYAALENAAKFVSAAVEFTENAHGKYNDGVMFEPFLSLLHKNLMEGEHAEYEIKKP